MKGIDGWKVSLGFALSFLLIVGGQSWARTLMGSVATASSSRAAEKALPHASRQKKTVLIPKAAKASDLSLERIFLKGCTVHVLLKNLGSGGLSDEDFNRAQLVVELSSPSIGKNATPKPEKYIFNFRKIDPQGVLKGAGGEVDFDTGIRCGERKRVKAQIQGLKADGKRGKKTLVSTLSPTSFCRALKRATGTASLPSDSVSVPIPAASSRGGVLKDNGVISGTGASRQGPSERDLERARALEMAEKMERIKTLEEAKGQRAFEAERERRGLWEEHEFGFSSDRKTNPRGGPVKEEGLLGPEKPQFEDYRDLMGYMTGDSTMRGLPGTPGEPRYGPKFGGGGWHPKPVAQWITTITASQLGYSYSSGTGPEGHWRGVQSCNSHYKESHDLMWLAFSFAELALALVDKGHEGAARYCVNIALRLIAEDSGTYFVLDDEEFTTEMVMEILDEEWLEENRDNLKDRDDPIFVNPEELLGSRLSLPWAPHRKHPVKRREEATDIERIPHAMDVYHYGYEKKKKGNERAGGAQVNPGSTFDAGEIRHYNEGAETVWKLKTLATDPDFPPNTQEQMERMNEQNVH